MLKYVDAVVTFAEIPDEITLCLNISGCPIHCPKCHSKYLWDDIGDELSILALTDLISSNRGITCVCFMGGDQNPEEIFRLAKFVKETYKDIKVAWYSGNTKLPKCDYLDYVKIGPYIEEYGPLNSETTNQKFYRIIHEDSNGDKIYNWSDITFKFWRNVTNP